MQHVCMLIFRIDSAMGIRCAVDNCGYDLTVCFYFYKWKYKWRNMEC